MPIPPETFENVREFSHWPAFEEFLKELREIEENRL